MEPRYLLAALSYFSIFFGGVLIPLVIALVTNDSYTKHHAWKALVSHVLPFAFILVFIISLLSGSVTISFGLGLLFFFISIGLVIWNVVMGIRVLREGNVF
ncbi:DUF4870 domain-containing protein [Paenibacillus sp. 481]|uniref:DUF4870 domain-containing protein n=1 Tax=Paenibacillus sp. 481 TaxID=2835869 RepID=UPI001E360F02|nr:DUF4870 domain-containing protein [Paenibacillus sp. 481]UHA74389.1 DUF4870 domain-containing protein [Paenibacillus sp. 481]